jgi:hypothetical protein
MVSRHVLIELMFAILFVVATSLTRATQSPDSTEDRRCYRPKWFTEGKCKLSEAAHRLRVNGGNDSCSSLPQYDCNSVYLATEGPSRHGVQSLTSFCRKGDVSEGLRSRNDYLVTCPYQYVCRHNSSRIPSTYWEARKLFDRRSSVCKEHFGLSAHCVPIETNMAFLANQGCDDNVGQYRYRLEKAPVTLGYACIRQ